MGEAKTNAFLGLHAISGTDWAGKFATIAKKVWVKSFLELDEDDEILDALSSLGLTDERPTPRVCEIKNSLAWYMHQSLRNELCKNYYGSYSE